MKVPLAIALLAHALVSLSAPASVPVKQAEPVHGFSEIQSRQLSNEENDITDGSPCKALTVIFARGTAETGNVGAITGPPFFQALYKDLGASKVALQGVDYPADVKGFLEGGDPNGSQTMANLVDQTASRCPNTKINISGYSQGGQLVHNAAKLLSAALTAKINSVVIFGDPDNGEPVGSIPSSQVLVICHVGDNICQHGDLVLAPHLTYSLNAQQAASFVVQKSGLSK